MEWWKSFTIIIWPTYNRDYFLPSEAATLMEQPEGTPTPTLQLSTTTSTTISPLAHVIYSAHGECLEKTNLAWPDHQRQVVLCRLTSQHPHLIPFRPPSSPPPSPSSHTTTTTTPRTPTLSSSLPRSAIPLPPLPPPPPASRVDVEWRYLQTWLPNSAALNQAKHKNSPAGMPSVDDSSVNTIFVSYAYEWLLVLVIWCTFNVEHPGERRPKSQQYRWLTIRKTISEQAD